MHQDVFPYTSKITLSGFATTAIAIWEPSDRMQFYFSYPEATPIDHRKSGVSLASVAYSHYPSEAH